MGAFEMRMGLSLHLDHNHGVDILRDDDIDIGPAIFLA